MPALPCVSDPEGNEYDLSGLSRVKKPWTAVDTTSDGKKRTFYLSVCNPLPYIPGCHGERGASDPGSPCPPSGPPSTALPALPGSMVGSCLVSEDKSLNLGVVQVSPQVAANGSLSVVYVNGDTCKDQRYSTRVILECAHTAVRVCRPFGLSDSAPAWLPFHGCRPPRGCHWRLPLPRSDAFNTGSVLCSRGSAVGCSGSHWMGFFLF